MTLRKAAGETRAELATAIDVHVTLIHKWEAGERHPSNRNMDKLFLHFGKDAGEFYSFALKRPSKRKRKAA